MKVTLRLAASFALALFFSGALVVHAQSSSVDLTFNPVPSAAMSNDDALGKGVLVQPDGKIVIWGGNFAVDGSAKGEIARLNADGTVDNTFTYCNCLETVSNVVVQPDGRLLVAGAVGTQPAIIRLNPSGSQDTSFVGSIILEFPFISSRASVVTLQPDGRILAAVNGAYCCGYHGGTLVRLNTDGTTDSTFTQIAFDSGRLISTALTALVIDPSGKLYLGTTTYSGFSTAGSLKRYNPNGTLDSTFDSPSFAPSTNSSVLGLALQADGGLIISGGFDSVNGASKINIARLLPAGNVDLTFTAPVFGAAAGQMTILPGGKILLAYNSVSQTKLARLNIDGSLDNTFAMSSTVQFLSSRYVLDATQRILFLGLSDRPEYRYFRLNPNGDRDVTFNPNVTLFGKVHTLARQTDGKILMAGKFTQVNGLERTSLARLNADGTLDPTLDAGSGFDSPPKYLIPLADGKMIAAADFFRYQEVVLPGIARIAADGSLDPTFSPTLSDNGYVTAAALQSDGKILIVGFFSSVNGIARTGVARLNANGSLDDSFNPVFGPGSFTSVIQQPDGKIMVAGTFSGVNGFNRSNFVRLTINGELDQSFNAGGFNPGRIWLQPDGKYLGTGITVTRRNVDGSADSSFAAPAFDTTGSNGRQINSLVIQADGSLIVGGRFELVGGVPRKNLVRLSSTGSLDLLFFPNGANSEVRTILPDAGGKVIIGGDFSRVENVSRPGIARLNIAPFRKATAFDFDGDGRADIAVVRPSTNRWYELFSSNGSVYEETFGVSGDILAPADFDGDGVTDEAIFRPSNGQWWYRSSVNGALVLNVWGANGDIPRPSDFDGDGRADLVLFRPSNNTWYRIGSLSPQQQAPPFAFGSAGDQPLVGDFDGDGKSDPAVFRPSNGDWWYAASSAGGAFRNVHWGQNGDIPVPADFDGDGKTDYAVFRPSDGGWYIYNSGNGSFTTTAFGLNGDRPVAADYDGDGRADLAVFRQSTGIWYLLRSTSGFAGYQFGISTDIAIAGSLIP